jgi:hypothetical protein
MADPECQIFVHVADVATTVWSLYFQVMLGCGKPETMGYADEELFKRRNDHLNARQYYALRTSQTYLKFAVTLPA